LRKTSIHFFDKLLEPNAHQKNQNSKINKEIIKTTKQNSNSKTAKLITKVVLRIQSVG